MVCHVSATAPEETEQFRTHWIHRWGRTGWSVVGIAVSVALVWTALAALSGLVIPLVVAAVIGVLGVPVVDALERRRVPRAVGAVAFIAVLAIALGLSLIHI